MIGLCQSYISKALKAFSVFDEILLSHARIFRQWHFYIVMLLTTETKKRSHLVAEIRFIFALGTFCQIYALRIHSKILPSRASFLISLGERHEKARKENGERKHEMLDKKTHKEMIAFLLIRACIQRNRINILYAPLILLSTFFWWMIPHDNCEICLN